MLSPGFSPSMFAGSTAMGAPPLLDRAPAERRDYGSNRPYSVQDLKLLTQDQTRTSSGGRVASPGHPASGRPSSGRAPNDPLAAVYSKEDRSLRTVGMARSDLLAQNTRPLSLGHNATHHVTHAQQLGLATPHTDNLLTTHAMQSAPPHTRATSSNSSKHGAQLAAAVQVGRVLLQTATASSPFGASLQPAQPVVACTSVPSIVDVIVPGGPAVLTGMDPSMQGGQESGSGQCQKLEPSRIVCV